MSNDKQLPAIAPAQLTHVHGGWPGEAIFKKAPIVSIPYKVGKSVKSGIDAAHSFADSERAGGINPSTGSQVGAGVINGVSTFIDESTYGAAGWLLRNTKPK